MKKPSKKEMRIFKLLVKREKEREKNSLRHEKVDYLDNLPEPRVIQLCDFCDSEATKIFIDFLGNKDYLCEKCYAKKIAEYELKRKTFMKANEN